MFDYSRETIILLYFELDEYQKIIDICDSNEFIISPKVKFNEYLYSLYKLNKTDKFNMIIEEELIKLKEIFTSFETTKNKCNSFHNETIKKYEKFIINIKNGTKPKNKFPFECKYTNYSLDDITYIID